MRRLRESVERRAGPVLDWLFAKGRDLPVVRSRIDKNIDEMLEKAPSPLGTYDAEHPVFDALPVE
jgi:hypothetical protein